MRLTIYLLLLTSLNAFSNVTDSLFSAGNNHYENKDYEKAIENYLSIDSSKNSHALYHNLGNCYYQIGNIPNSILYYERALLIRNDSKTQDNLKLAKKRTQEIEVIPTLFFIGWWNSIVSFLDTKLWIIFFTIFLWVSCFILFLFLKNRQKRTFNLFLTTITFTILLVIISQRSYYLNNKKYAIVTSKTHLISNITDSQTTKALNPGNKILIIDKKDGRSLVRLADGSEGWINNNSFLEL